MNKIECPKCGEIFKVDESKYADILTQVRNAEFNREVVNRVNELKANDDIKIALERAKYEKTFNEELAKKEAQNLDLRAQLSNAKKDEELAVITVTRKLEKDISALETRVKEAETKLSIEIEVQKQNKEIELSKQKEQFLSEIKNRDEELLRVKEYRLNQSTKMVGESLERYCEEEFFKHRALGLFLHASFEKDNDIGGGTKGDYIYRETDSDGNEVLTVMFEMKNESDSVGAKKKNESHFEKLDKDRRAKNCEYAVLVSMLEQSSEFYNTGIVDVSYRHEKMYVIRPQFFIAILSILRNAAVKNMAYKKQLRLQEREDLDMAEFSVKFADLTRQLGENYRKSGDNFDKAIDSIDSAIKDLEKTKEFLRLTHKWLGAADTKISGTTVKKLVKGLPSLEEKLGKLLKDD